MNHPRLECDRSGIDPTAIVRHGRTASKHARLVAEAAPEGARRGQIFILFAFFALAMFGMLGLATDVGYAMAARRAVQGAADAGAIAGARMIARYTSTTPVAAEAEVASIVTSNTFGGTAVTLYDCEYIGNNWSVVGQCTSTVPSTAAGSRIQTRLTFPTFFMRVFPSLPEELEVQGYAKARVQRASASGASAPFIVCGYDAWDVTGDVNTNTGGTNTTIISQESPLRLQSSAVGKTFRIWDNKLGQQGADCDIHPQSFKGLADQDENETRSAPGWFKYKSGTAAGPTRAEVKGTQGCDEDAEEPYNCVMLLPIADNDPVGSHSDKTIYVLGYAAFYVTVPGPNYANGVLLDDYITSGGGSDNWCRDCGGAVVIRLIWP